MDTDIAFTFFEQNHERPICLAFAGGEVVVYSRRGPHNANVNEDAAGLISSSASLGALVVADGCGGMARGEVAARIAVETLQNSVATYQDTSTSGLRSVILDSMEGANQRIRDLSTGAATTLAIVEVDGSEIRSYHVGDSQILLVGNRGKVKLQTRSHSPVAYAVEAGVLSEQEAIHHEDRHLVSNILGTIDTHIEIGPRRKMSRRDTLLVASDGLTDNLHLDEIVEIIRKGRLLDAAEQLQHLAARRMNNPTESQPSKSDDLTFILFRCNAPTRG